MIGIRALLERITSATFKETSEVHESTKDAGGYHDGAKTWVKKWEGDLTLESSQVKAPHMPPHPHSNEGGQTLAFGPSASQTSLDVTTTNHPLGSRKEVSLTIPGDALNSSLPTLDEDKTVG